MYVDVLKVLAQKDSCKIDNIAGGLNIGEVELKICLTFLVKQGLVDKRKGGNYRLVYLITIEGIKVLRHFNEPTQVVPSIG